MRASFKGRFLYDIVTLLFKENNKTSGLLTRLQRQTKLNDLKRDYFYKLFVFVN